MQKEIEKMASRVFAFDKMIGGFKDAIDYVQRGKK